jgi:CRISPR-associated protein Csb2
MIQFCITVRWLDDRYHGQLGRDGPREWPPSPFRLFQALVAGVGRRGQLDGEAGKSLAWLESLGRPMIIAPPSHPGQVITRFVPNNDGDKVPDRQNRLTGKTSRPTIMLDPFEVHYIWPVKGDCPELRGLIEASGWLTCLGWGIDMAYGDGEVLDDGRIEGLSGIRWSPIPDTLRDDGLLRVPMEGSMSDLRRAHESALSRIEAGKPLRSVHKPQVFDRVFYGSAERPLGRPAVVFGLRTDDDEMYRYPHAKLIHIAGMTRSAAIKAMKVYPPEDVGEGASVWVENFVAGHRPEGADNHKQFSYVPIPSIGHGHADAMIRRVMIVAPFGHEVQLRHLADQLDGEQLKPEGGGEGPVLYRLCEDGVTRCYLGSSAVWASVTPIILPGHDDHKPEKTAKLIERALRQSGIDQPCRFTWGAIPNFEHCLTAHKYDRNGRPTGYHRPRHLEALTAIHVRISFDHPVAGPLTIGAGRHCGLGVLAAQAV